nr:uncharacterized protein LOC124814292 [Hydra vulgaris]
MHCVDGTTTIANPDLTLNMGYNSTNIKPRKSLNKRCPKSNFLLLKGISTKCNDTNNTTEDNTNELCSNNNNNAIYLPPPSCEHSYASQSLLNMCEGSFLQKLSYWRGPKHVQNTSKLKRRFQSTKYRKLSHHDEFFLTLMQLRLGIFNEDIAEQFRISPTTSSYIFSTWIKLISNVLGSALIVWLPRETIRENLPRVFKNAGYDKCCVIIDFAEIFIEQPKSLLAQVSTWSNYKQHNMFMFLVGISPSGFITFLTDCYGGRCSDNFITKDSGFYDLLERV